MILNMGKLISGLGARDEIRIIPPTERPTSGCLVLYSLDEAHE
jgi:hypothetical protein